MDIQKERILDINFNSFLSISGINKIINRFKPDPKAEVIKQAQFLLETKNYDAYAVMLSKGYEPTPKQQNLIDEYVDKILSDSPNTNIGSQAHLYQKLEHLLENGLQLSYRNIACFIENNGGIYNNIEILYNKNYILRGLTENTSPDYGNNQKLLKFPNFTKQFHNLVEEPGFSDYLLKEFQKSLKKDFGNGNGNKKHSIELTVRTYEYVLTHAPQLIFRNTSFEDVTKIIKKLNYKDIRRSHSDILNNIVNKLYTKNLDSLFENTQSNFAGNMVENLTLKNIRNEQHNIKELPKTALKLIDDIENIYKKIKGNNFDDPEKINTLNILLEKRLPEVLGKYLKVDPEYRKTLKSSQGKNAEDLMIDSLENIKNNFISVFEEINQNTVNSLSATNRYTKSLKM